MKEISDIIIAFDEAQKSGRQTALVTLVHVDGSSYRRPGARMLVTDEGQLTGAISGGCLEGDALRKALHVMNQQKSMLVIYDTTDEDDAKLGIGLGCNGIIQVLIEPVKTTDKNNPVELLKAISGKRQNAVLVTLFSLQNKKEEQAGTCVLIKENEIISSFAKDYFFEDALLQDAGKAMEEQITSFKNYVSATQNITAFIEFIPPPVSLVVIGAGNDTMPLVEMAAIVGWETIVVDGRPNYAKRDRFESACQVIVSKPGNVLEQIIIDAQTVFVLMTHNYNYDLAMLKVLAEKNIVYIGSLGPKKKLDRMLEELKEDGIELTNAQLANIYGPSGLDIGAETPGEIALSILAEIKAVLAGKQGSPLRSNADVIHPRTETVIEKINLSS
jgi:xanthine dehydrogenase accessory factor